MSNIQPLVSVKVKLYHKLVCNDDREFCVVFVISPEIPPYIFVSLIFGNAGHTLVIHLVMQAIHFLQYNCLRQVVYT